MAVTEPIFGRRTLVLSWLLFTAAFVATQFLAMGLKTSLLVFDPVWRGRAGPLFARIYWDTSVAHGLGAGFWYGVLLFACRRPLCRRGRSAFLLAAGLGVAASLIRYGLDAAVFVLWIRPRLRPLPFAMPFAHSWAGEWYRLLDLIAATAAGSVVGACVFRRPPGPRVPLPAVSQGPGDWPPAPELRVSRPSAAATPPAVLPGVEERK